MKVEMLLYKDQECQLVMHPEISQWRTKQTMNIPLMNDMRARGQLQNMVARKLPNEKKIELLAGYQRHMVLLGLNVKPQDMEIKILENVSDEEAILIAFSENNTRTDLTTVEEARVYASLSKLKMTHKQIGKKCSKSETYVRDRLHLLQLPKNVQKLINSGAVPVSYAGTIRKLNGYPTAQLALANKITMSGYGRINTKERAEEVVTEVLAEVAAKEALVAEYGACPKCGSTDIEMERWEKNKIDCNKCKHSYHAKTKDPWKVFELKKRAKDIGLELEVTKEGETKLTPKEVTEIVQERTAVINEVEHPNPTIRSMRTLEQMLRPLISDGITSLSIENDTLICKLRRDTNLHFKAVHKAYTTGEKSKVVISEGWRDNEKIRHRMPIITKFLETLGD